MADFTVGERKILARRGEALPDGSFPIRNRRDLSNAIHDYGRADPAKRGRVRSHIEKRARALGAVDLIPKEWK